MNWRTNERNKTMAKKIEYATTAEIKVGDIIQARLDGRAIKVENIETATEKDGTTSRIFLGKTCLKDGMPSKVSLHRYIHESNVMKVNGKEVR